MTDKDLNTVECMYCEFAKISKPMAKGKRYIQCHRHAMELVMKNEEDDHGAWPQEWLNEFSFCGDGIERKG